MHPTIKCNKSMALFRGFIILHYAIRNLCKIFNVLFGYLFVDNDGGKKGGGRLFRDKDVFGGCECVKNWKSQ